MNHQSIALPRRSFLASSAALLAGWAPGGSPAQDPARLFGRQRAMPELDAVAWLNSPPLAAKDLRGKVVLVQFWTFTCVNWQRTQPYIDAWSGKYGQHGLTVVGVHTPEFSFEQDIANVRAASEQLGVQYPVAVDSRRSIWTAFRNAAWPALYLVDARGVIRHQQDGEGQYAGAEQRIQRLLREAGASAVPAGLVQPQGRGAKAAADWPNLRSAETYTGHQRADRFRSPGGMVADARQVYEFPAGLGSGGWAASGLWTFAGEAARSESAGAKVRMRFHARDLHLVMGAGHSGGPVPFRVRIDGQPPGAAHGVDTDRGGRGVLEAKRLYHLVRQGGGVQEREFEIEFLGPGSELYAFTFG